MKARRFQKGVCNHVYQRTIDRFNIFYDTADYLVYFTIFCVIAARYKLSVLSLCLMIDHIHILVTAIDKKALSDFISNVTSVFVREYNASLARKGSLFDSRFGSAPKLDKKRLISAIIYLGNNPVERRVCDRAELYRWNFLAYLNSDSPFSDPISMKKISQNLKRSLRIVDWCHSSGKYLNYTLLNNLMKDLTHNERNQLVDYIVAKYNVIDAPRLMSYFGTYDQMLLAMHSTTGSEYDLKEHNDRSSDAIYRDMLQYVNKSCSGRCRTVIMLPDNLKRDLLWNLKASTGASSKQIKKFLHLNIC